MSKRKVVAGGYEESSDGPDFELDFDTENPAKKAKSASYAPIRLTTMPKTGTAPFQLPQSRSSSAHSAATHALTPFLSSSRLPSGAASLPPAVPSAPQSEWAMVDATSPNSEPEILASHKAGGDNAIHLAPNPSTNPVSVLTKTTQARSNIALERQLNGVLDEFKSYASTNNAQHKQTHDTLAYLLEVVSRLVPSESMAFTPALGQPASASSVTLDSKPLYSNPAATPELIATVSKVVADARNRVGKKKGGSEDNSLKEHARTTFYRMLGITAAKAIQPYFEDDFGDPDTLPAQFMDPDTKYCQPYPHWKAPLTKQTAWIPTYILRFRSTIPSDRSELSTLLKSLSEEQIVILLNDGPFKTAQTVWRDMKKSDEELEVMRKNSRRYQRAERKATIRGRYIKMIPSLQSPEWEFLSHSGYMSQDESDDEVGFITRRPNHRSQWATNLYEAIHVAQLEKNRSQPGLCPRPPQRRIEISDCPIPQLERGTGSSKVTVRIALCGVSKSWRDNHPSELLKHGHYINSKVFEKPDIRSFLAQHPMPKHDGDASDGETEGNGAGQSETSVGPDGGGYGTGQNQGDASQDATDQELGRDVGVEHNNPDTREGGAMSDGGFGAANGAGSTGANGNFTSSLLIDPQLLPFPADNNAAQGDQNQPGPTRQQALDVAHSGSSVDITLQTSGLVGPQTTHDPSYTSHHLPPSDMPPPPPLPVVPAVGLAPANAMLVSNEGASKPTTRQRRKAKETTGNETASSGMPAGGSSAPGPSDTPVVDPNAPQPKRRGRPPGAKNKPK
ncbi:hypothetical protein FS749_015622 [Ceratobasidium sp. UAMH 11750]|nr:hypothetical protein FS749_015622 [Ceratobasidium sp. UAMH 11750]